MVNLILLILIVSTQNVYYYALALGAMALSLYNFIRDYLIYFIREKTELNDIKEQSIGNFKTDEIKSLIHSIFLNFKGREIPRIYIVDEPLAGTHVIDTYILNFIGPINAIYVPRHEFHYLKPAELKAILSHEIGHFYQYIYPAQRFSYPFYFFVTIIPAFLAPFVNMWLIGLVFVGLQYAFYPSLNKLFNYKSKTLEYLSDLFASDLCGKLNVINALMVSSKYSELIEVLRKKVLKLIEDNDQLSMDSYDEIFEKLVRILPDKPNSTDEVDKILSDAISGFSLNSFLTKMTKRRVLKEKAIIADLLSSPELARKRELLNWDVFDFVEKNHRVEEEEYDALIANIINSQLCLVDSVNDDEREDLNDTHPALRQRILFLDKNVSEINAQRVH
jgi:Zn-dependent protease with chaperone function